MSNFLNVNNDSTRALRNGMNYSLSQIKKYDEMLGSGKAQIRAGDDPSAYIMGTRLSMDAETIQVNTAELQKGMLVLDIQNQVADGITEGLREMTRILAKYGLSDDASNIALMRQYNEKRAVMINLAKNAQFGGVKVTSALDIDNDAVNDVLISFKSKKIQDKYNDLINNVFTANAADYGTKLASFTAAITAVKGTIDITDANYGGELAKIKTAIEKIDAEATDTILAELQKLNANYNTLLDYFDTNAPAFSATANTLATAIPATTLTIADSADKSDILASDASTTGGSDIVGLALDAAFNAAIDVNKDDTATPPVSGDVTSAYDSDNDVLNAFKAKWKSEIARLFSAKFATPTSFNTIKNFKNAYDDGAGGGVKGLMGANFEKMLDVKIATSTKLVNEADDSTYFQIKGLDYASIVEDMPELNLSAKNLAAEFRAATIAAKDATAKSLMENGKLGAAQSAGDRLISSCSAISDKTQAAADAYLNADASSVTRQRAATELNTQAAIAAMAKSIQLSRDMMQRLIQSV